MSSAAGALRFCFAIRLLLVLRSLLSTALACAISPTAFQKLTNSNITSVQKCKAGARAMIRMPPLVRNVLTAALVCATSFTMFQMLKNRNFILKSSKIIAISKIIAMSRGESFIVLDRRAEQMGNARFCLAHAVIVSQSSDRVFVAPSVRSGRIIDPKITSMDALDFWDLRSAVPSASIVSMKQFLRLYPLVQKNGHWLPGGNASFGIVERWANPHESESVLGQELRAISAEVVILREDESTNMCWRFSLDASTCVQRHALWRVMDKPSALIDQYAKTMLTRLGGYSLIVQWRSMLHTLMMAMKNEGGSHNKSQGKKPPIEFELCAKEIKAAAEEVLSYTNFSNILIFSDIHTGCEGGACGYREFDALWMKNPMFDKDRGRAVQLFAESGWINGDALIAEYMLQHPIQEGYGDDGGLLGILVEQFCAKAPAFLTCTESDCSNCARTNSMFTKAIVAKRSESSSAKCATWLSWRSKRRPESCLWETAASESARFP